MAKLISTKYTKAQYANQTITLPVVGVVEFDQDGNVDVPADKVQAVLLATKDSFAFKVDRVVVPEDLSKQPVNTTPDKKAASKKKQQDEENVIKQNLANEVVGKEPVDDNQPLSELSEADQEVKNELEQADLATLVQLASDVPELADKELAGMTDVQLRQELLKVMTKQ